MHNMQILLDVCVATKLLQPLGVVRNIYIYINNNNKMNIVYISWNTYDKLKAVNSSIIVQCYLFEYNVLIRRNNKYYLCKIGIKYNDNIPNVLCLF